MTKEQFVRAFPPDARVKAEEYFDTKGLSVTLKFKNDPELFDFDADSRQFYARENLWELYMADDAHTRLGEFESRDAAVEFATARQWLIELSYS